MVQKQSAIAASAQDYTEMTEDGTIPSQPVNVITDDTQLVSDGVNQIRTGVGAGIHEEDLDKQFFSKNLSQDQYKKLKLNKGEKRALKFILKRSGMGENIDLTKLTKTGDLAELKQMLGLEVKKHNDKLTQDKPNMNKNYIETGGGGKRKVGGNNSNKMWDYRDMIKDDSD